MLSHLFFFFNDTATTEIYTLSLHDALPISPGYFERVKEILDETGILFISDEVQTAFGRTGSHFWGIEAFDVEPDMVTMAKGLGNGLSIGAVMGRAELLDSLSPKQHVSTFRRNHPLRAGRMG